MERTGEYLVGGAVAQELERALGNQTLGNQTDVFLINRRLPLDYCQLSLSDTEVKLLTMMHGCLFHRCVNG